MCTSTYPFGDKRRDVTVTDNAYSPLDGRQLPKPKCTCNTRDITTSVPVSGPPRTSLRRATPCSSTGAGANPRRAVPVPPDNTSCDLA
ncbi:hypothetical protein SFRURICE_016260 [Spodoptera frugiperda]|uniref:SFRICE_025784 n=1 Tax=Spodoptera frugiperda TaxID=7108 RepID=A0A2H1WMX4_SPOFR|nr:hypothetical protein SFRURICE_016260 [Spodoptera frugiperda]